MKLNEKILYCRKKGGLSQEALAEQLGVSRQAVSKWETGDAVPEIGKLLLLAKQFDVTTDWLLSEEEPEENKENDYRDSFYESKEWHMEEESAKESSSIRFKKAAEDWMDTVPGVLGKLVRRFGWIAGAYIAVSGAGLAGIGLLMRILTGSMMNSFNNAANSMMTSFGGGMFGGNSVTFYDEHGNVMNARESAKMMELFENSGEIMFSGGDYFINSGSSMTNSMFENNPVSVLAGIMIVVGLLMLVGGTVLAVIWKKKAAEQN